VKDMTEAVFTTKQVAERLGVDTKTVLRYLRSGRLKGSKLAKDWRIPASSVDRLLTNEPASAVRAGVARVTAVVNQKGGVGKTTTTYNLGSGLQRLGRRVLLIDLDPQAALTTYAGIYLPNVTTSIYQLLLDDSVDPLSVIRETTSGVHVLPANIDLAAAEIELVSMISREQVLKDVWPSCCRATTTS